MFGSQTTCRGSTWVIHRGVQDTSLFIRSIIQGGMGNLRRFSFWLWIITIVFFAANFIYVVVFQHKIYTEVPSLFAQSLLIDVIIGVFAFIVFILSLISSSKNSTPTGKNEHIEEHRIANQSFNPWFALSMILLILLAYLIGSKNTAFLGISITPTPTASPIISASPTNTTVNSVVTTATDPPVHCKISPECGGGTTPLKQSECANSICCGFPGGKWVFYKDKNQCIRDQGGTINTQPVQNNGNQQTATPYPSPNVQSHCLSLENSDNESCKTKCLTEKINGETHCSSITQSSADSWNCIFAAGGPSELYATCMQACSAKYAISIQKCYK